MRAILAQAAMELRLTVRRGENLLVTLIIPLALLLFLAGTDIFALGSGSAIEFLVPGVLALAVMSIGLVSLGIATAYERHYGVLKRLGGTPLSRAQLVAAKLLAVLLIEVVQFALIAGAAALFFGWRPAGSIPLALALAGLGTVAFVGLGLLLAGTLRAEATLAVANGLYLVLLLIGGIFLPVDHLPDVLALLAPFLPATALASLLRSTLTGTELPTFSLIVLVLWAVGTVSLAAWLFRWE